MILVNLFCFSSVSVIDHFCIKGMMYTWIDLDFYILSFCTKKIYVIYT